MCEFRATFWETSSNLWQALGILPYLGYTGTYHGSRVDFFFGGGGGLAVLNRIYNFNFAHLSPKPGHCTSLAFEPAYLESHAGATKIESAQPE